VTAWAHQLSAGKHRSQPTVQAVVVMLAAREVNRVALQKSQAAKTHNSSYLAQSPLLWCVPRDAATHLMLPCISIVVPPGLRS
jgi:hypothetical protein